MRHLKINLTWKRFMGDSAMPVGTMTATLKDNRVTFNSVDLARIDLPHLTLASLRDVVRTHVRTFCDDSRYPYLWNEESGIESHLQETN